MDKKAHVLIVLILSHNCWGQFTSEVKSSNMSLVALPRRILMSSFC